MLDLTRPVQTRDGRPARIISTDLKSDWPLVAAVTYADGRENLFTYRMDGKIDVGASFNFDLVNKPYVHERWEVWEQFPRNSDPFNVLTFSTEEEARGHAAKLQKEIASGKYFGRVFAVTHRKVTEGEGL